jgi:E3 ubiquitin-protein ligase UBR4
MGTGCYRNSIFSCISTVSFLEKGDNKIIIFFQSINSHNNYLSEATGIRETTYTLSVHDLKLLIQRFAENQSFSEDTGGGGRESNICLIPYMIHTILYSINV